MQLMAPIIIAVVLLGHGIGHSMGIFQTYGIATVNPSWDGRSWLLSDVAGPTTTRLVAVALWTVAMVGFVVLAGVVMGWLPEAWWGPLAVVSSVASLIGLALFPAAFPVFSTIGALGVDLVVLAAVLWFRWVPSDLGT
jgi:hypothetical protein